MAFSITPRLIIAAAEKRGFKVTILSDRFALYKIEVPGKGFYYVRNIASIKSASITGFIVKQKEIFYELAQGLGLRVPETITLGDDLEEAKEFLKKHKQVVVKPSDQGHGDGITVNITTDGELISAIEYAKTFGNTILLQQYVSGDDYRLLFIDNKLAAAAMRKPAYVVGDGKQTIRGLIDAENGQPYRSSGYNNLLTVIDVGQAERYLGSEIDRVPALDEEVRVMGISNIGKGGVSIDVTETVLPEMLAAGQQVVDHLGMGLCGVDFLLSPEGPYLIEANALPSLGLHETPFKGEPQNTPDKFLDWLVK